jgi:hypothetical protein
VYYNQIGGLIRRINNTKKKKNISTATLVAPIPLNKRRKNGKEYNNPFLS